MVSSGSKNAKWGLQVLVEPAHTDEKRIAWIVADGSAINVFLA
jgi:hypothetical protein